MEFFELKYLSFLIENSIKIKKIDSKLNLEFLIQN